MPIQFENVEVLRHKIVEDSVSGQNLANLHDSIRFKELRDIVVYFGLCDCYYFSVIDGLDFA